MKNSLICSLLMALAPLAAATPLSESAFDMISISADEAIEDERPVLVSEDGVDKGVITRADLLRTVIEGTEMS